jgi:hypothetical protein
MIFLNVTCLLNTVGAVFILAIFNESAAKIS